MCNVQMVGQGFGAATTAMGSYYAAKSNRNSVRMDAMTADAAAKNRQMGLDYQSASAGMQAAIGDINAKMAEGTAQATLLSGQREEQKSRIATSNLKSTQRANLAANGVDLGVGSAENILTTTDVMGEIDANTIQANAVRSAWGYRAQAQNYKGQADVARATQYGAAVMADADRKTSASALAWSNKMADSIRPGAAFGTSLLSGMGKVADSWYSYSKSSAGSGGGSNWDPDGSYGRKYAIGQGR